MRLVPALSLSLASCMPTTAHPTGGHGGARNGPCSHTSDSYSYSSVSRGTLGCVRTRTSAARGAFHHLHGNPFFRTCLRHVVNHFALLEFDKLLGRTSPEGESAAQ